MDDRLFENANEINDKSGAILVVGVLGIGGGVYNEEFPPKASEIAEFIKNHYEDSGTSTVFDLITEGVEKVEKQGGIEKLSYRNLFSKNET
jgi:hypothetical protein